MPSNVIMPQMGESIFEGTITKWLKKVGDPVKRDEPLFEISTDKVDSEIPAPASGFLSEIRVNEGETAQINTIVGVISEATAPLSRESAKAETAPTTRLQAPQPLRQAAIEPARSGLQAPSTVPRTVRSSPLVKRIAREEDVDLAQLQGTGLGGRITKKDILSHLSGRLNTGAPSGLHTEAAERSATAVEVVPMSAMRKSIAEHMMASRRTSAHVTTVFEVDLTRIVNIKTQHAQEYLRQEGHKLSYMPFFIKTVAGALKEFPVVNASVSGTDIVYRKEINIGVAVALDWGLIVPVVKHADEKSFLGIAKTASSLAERARQKKLVPEDVQGGTFTITNPGVFGSLFGTPIINQPQVAILCIGAITKRPIVINDAIAIRSMAYLTLTFDHRLIDGAVADPFMSSLKNKLEQWDEPLF
ncbi:MAG: dihydrolipoyllysine-residue succinyltransferase [Acidimicrobiia bacterium]|nr:dihydrolipoyllysine-residue succinyltransferase [Acidimicrobiia bacterium]